MKKLFIAVLLALLGACGANASDVPIYPTGPVYSFPATSLGTLTWGVSGPGGFNNNFYFVPLALNENVCVFVRNNNTSNPHTFTAAIAVTSDPKNTTPSDGTWQFSANSANLSAATSPGLPGGIGASVSGVSQVSVNFSASATQAGSPDTASVSVIQTTGNCFSGNQFIGSAPQTVTAVPAIQGISEGLSQAFETGTTITNPTSGQNLISVEANNGTRALYFDQLLITTTAADTITIEGINSAGVTCSTNNGGNLKIGNTTASTALAQFSCTTNPTQIVGAGGLGIVIAVPSTGPIIVDLRGLVAPAGSTFGLMVISSAVTGTVNTTIFWHEK